MGFFVSLVFCHSFTFYLSTWDAGPLHTRMSGLNVWQCYFSGSATLAMFSAFILPLHFKWMFSFHRRHCLLSL